MTGDNFVNLSEKYLKFKRLERGELPRIKPMPKSDDLGLGVAIALILTGVLCLVLLFFPRQAQAQDVVIETIAREASGEPFQAQVLVASVIKQRMIDRHLSAEKVCLQRKQFSCWNEGVKQKPRTPQELEIARMAWEQAESMGINLYHDISITPWWAKRVTFICQVGRLKFYKEER